MTALCRCESATQRPNSIKLPVLIAATLLTTLVPRGLGQENVQQKVQAKAQALLAHQSFPESQTAAGGRLSFEVASVRPADPGAPVRSNFSMDIEDTSIPPGGRFSALSSLRDCIEFAYKIMPTRKQEDAMLAHLPKWVSTDRFAIEAKAEGNPDKDQMRLMMRSLLAARFKLAVHFETHEAPVLYSAARVIFARPRMPKARPLTSPKGTESAMLSSRNMLKICPIRSTLSLPSCLARTRRTTPWVVSSTVSRISCSDDGSELLTKSIRWLTSSRYPICQVFLLQPAPKVRKNP
jgi:hypothetical protein